MTAAAPASRPPRVRRRRGVVAWTIIVAFVVALIAFFIFARLYTNVLWFSQLGYVGVLTRQWYWGCGMFAVGVIAMGVPAWLCMYLPYRLRPIYTKLNAQLSRYQQLVEPLRRLAFWVLPAIVALFSGIAAASHWQLAAMFINSTPSGTKDPQFHLDTSFYMFQLPFLRSMTAFSSAVLIVAFLLTIVVSYLYGSIRLMGRQLHILTSVRVQLSVIAALYLAVQAISIWLDRYVTLTDSNLGGAINGAAYTDVNAIIPARAILSGVAFIVAALFIVTAIIGRWRYPLVGLGLLLVSALVIGTIYPWGVQNFYVSPNQKQLEQSYIGRAIDGTRAAYDVAGVTEQSYNATTTTQSGQLRKDATTTASIRIMDPSIVSPAFSQLQQYKQFYAFPSQLSVDRYDIDGTEQDAVVGVRELNQRGLDSSARTWYNDTFVYTHGYGVVAAAGNTRTSDGTPQFIESGIPSTGELGVTQPDVYFGMSSPQYSIVGAPKDSKPVEFDYPGGADNASVTYNTYQGSGGPSLNSFFNRLAYAMKFGNEQILISGAINNDSEILYNRNPVSRVEAAAPYLTIDSTPYPSVINGRIVWILDGYTTSDNYPYSQQVSYSSAIANSALIENPYTVDNINYIRNSVKATVDAYTGKVTLYAWDTSDPVLKTWEKIFPNTLKPVSDMSSALMSHVRYPQDLFKVQRSILATYHVTDPGSFYSSEDAWKVPDDPATNNSQSLQPPYYLTMQVPGQDSPSFSLYSTFIPQSTSSDSRSLLKGYLSVDSDAGNDPGHPSSDYGKLRLLTVPPEDSVPGPGSVQANVESDPGISAQLNVLRVGGATKVTYGNLLTIPVGGGLLYVEPVYVQSQGSTSYPLLQEVIVSFGSKNEMAPTLDQALDELFGGNSGASAGDAGSTSETNSGSPGSGSSGTGTSGSGSTATGTGSGSSGSSGSSSSSKATSNPGATPTTGSTQSPSPSNTPGISSGGSGSTGSSSSAATNPAVQKALQEAQAALTASQDALKSGDWAAYGDAQKQLQQAINAALSAEASSSDSSSSSSSSKK